MLLREIVSHLYIDERKLTEYALNYDNPKGKEKAIMFEKHLGFTPNNYQLLLQQIYEKTLNHTAILQQSEHHGDRYQVDLTITGVKIGQEEIVRTGWLVEQNSNTARLITLFIKKRK